MLSVDSTSASCRKQSNCKIKQRNNDKKWFNKKRDNEFCYLKLRTGAVEHHLTCCVPKPRSFTKPASPVMSGLAALETEATRYRREPRSKALSVLTFWADVRQVLKFRSALQIWDGESGWESCSWQLSKQQQQAEWNKAWKRLETGNLESERDFSLGTVRSAEWRRASGSLTSDSAAEAVLHSRLQDHDHREPIHCTFPRSWRRTQVIIS